MMSVKVIILLVFLTIVNISAAELNSTDTFKANKSVPFKFLFFREDCLKEFMNFNFSSDCISLTISKFLGYGIIFGALAVKLPQVFNLLKSGSAEGLVASMFYTECYMYIINGCYNIHLGSPFSVYGENFCILAQNLIIIFLVWRYRSDNSKLGIFLITTTIPGLFVYLYMDIMPEHFWNYLMNAQILLITSSRIPQIYQNFSQKSTGQLALITYILNAAGN